MAIRDDWAAGEVLTSTDLNDTLAAYKPPTGSILPYAGSTAPTGWLMCAGTAGTPVTQSTYPELWSVLTAGGTIYPYGGSGATTYTPDLRGRVVAGVDNMGGTAASRLTSTTITGGGDAPGEVGGAQTHTLGTAEIPSHDHSTPAHTHTVGARDNLFASTNGVVVGNATFDTSDPFRSSGGGTSGSTGGGGAHNNVQPTMVLNYIIFTL